MSRVSEIVGKFPANELTLHRLYANSETFRTICADYLDASRALEFWRSSTSTANDKSEEYRKIMDELEKEITELVERTDHSDERRQK